MKIKIILPLHCLCLLVVMLPAIWSRAGNWPAWRGPAGTGVCTERDLPLHWSTNENVRWRAPLPERGNSTPIIWGERVFILQSRAETVWSRRPRASVFKPGASALEHVVDRFVGPGGSAAASGEP